MSNFHQEAEDLKKAGAARQSRHAGDFLADVAELASDAGQRLAMGSAAAQFVRSRQGAAARTAGILNDLLLLENAHA